MKEITVNQTREQVDKIILSKSLVNSIKDSSAALADDLGLDSLSMVEIIVDIETELGIEIDLEFLNPDYLTTVSSIYEIVEKSMEIK